MKRYSIFLIIRERQVEATIRYHLTSLKLAIIKKTTDNKYWRGCRVDRNVYWCGHYGKLWRFCKKLKIELPYDPTVSLLSMYLKKMKSLIQKDTCTQCSQKHYLQQPRYESKLSVYQQIDGKKYVGHVYNRLLLLLSHFSCV